MSHHSHYLLEPADVSSALPDHLAFKPQQITEFLLEPVVHSDGRVDLKELF